MNKKILIPIFAILIIIGGLGVYFIFQKSNAFNPQPTPSATKDSPFGISIAGFLSNQNYEKSLSLMKEAGAGTVRFMAKPQWGSLSWSFVEKEKGTFDWSELDAHYMKAKDSGLNIMVNIYPDTPEWDSDSDYIMDYPNDMEEYLNFIKKAVERYDGDGTADAPGHPKVAAWILGVEMERGKGKKWWGGTPEEYANLFVKTYETIKSANNEAIVMTYGANNFLNIETGAIDSFTRPMLTKLNELTENKPYFSFVYSLHFYPTDNFENYIFTIDYTRDMLDDYGFVGVPIVIDDVAPFFRKDDALREQKAAKMIIQTYIMGLAHGVKEIIWAQLSDGLEYGKNFEAGVISNSNMTAQDKNYYKNLGFYAYKLLTEKLAGSDWNNIQTIQESDGIYIYKFTKNNKPVWVTWNDNKESRRIKITLEEDTKDVKITEAVPKYESGKEVKDYSNAFGELKGNILESYPMQLDFEIGEKPVFVEEQ